MNNDKDKHSAEEQEKKERVTPFSDSSHAEEPEAGKEEVLSKDRTKTLSEDELESKTASDKDESQKEATISSKGEASGKNDAKQASFEQSKAEKVHKDLSVEAEKTQNKEHEQRERQLQQSLLEAELKALRLENEIRQLNDEYTKKVTEKANEAQKLVNKRLGELQDDFAAQTSEAKKYALKSGGARLAEILQQFDMVLSTSQKAGEAVKNYAQGFAMVFDMLVKTLADLGIKEIPVKPGDDFDHDVMEIFEGVDSKDHKHNQVVDVLKKGYRLHDKVIVHAVVRVAN